MDSFLNNRIKAKRPQLLEEIVESPFESARARFNNNKIHCFHNHHRHELIAGRNSHHFSRFDHTNKSPEYYTKKMSDPMHKIVSVKYIARLELQLKTATIRWILKFIELGGVQLLIQSLKLCSHFENEMEYRILSCFRALSNNYVGIRESFSNSDFIDQVTLSMCSSSLSCRTMVCEILISMCYYKYPKCQRLVLAALEKLTLQHNATSKNPFEAWITCWRETIRYKTLKPVDECEYSSINFMLVNAIINVCDNQDTRIELRKQMEDGGLEKIFDTAVRNEEIYMQIEEFFVQWNRDRLVNDNSIDNGLTAPTNSTRVFKNLLDPRNILDMLLDNLQGTRCYTHFVNCLQNMLMFITTHSDLDSKFNYMKSIDYYSFTQCNVILTYEKAVGIIEEQKNQLSNAHKDLQKYKALYENGIVNHTHEEKLDNQIQKNKSLEDLLRMSRNTIKTLQLKLKDIQEEYEENITTLEKQLDHFYKISDAFSHNKDDRTFENEVSSLILTNKIDGKKFARQKVNVNETRRDECLEAKNEQSTIKESIENADALSKRQRRRAAMEITDDFKLQLAMQFSKTNLSTLVEGNTTSNINGEKSLSKVHRRHSIMFNYSTGDSIESLKNEKRKNRLSLMPEALSIDKYNVRLVNDHAISTFNSPPQKRISAQLYDRRKAIVSAGTTRPLPCNTMAQEEHLPILSEHDQIAEISQPTLQNTAMELRGTCDINVDCIEPLSSISESSLSSNESHSAPTLPACNFFSDNLTPLHLSSHRSDDNRTHNDISVHGNILPIEAISNSTTSITIRDTEQSKDTFDEIIAVDTPVPPPPPPPPPPLPDFDSAKSNQTVSTSICTTDKSCPSKHDSYIQYYPSVKTRMLQWQKLHKNNIDATIWSETDQNPKSSSGNLETTLSEAGLFKKMEETFGQHEKTKKSIKNTIAIRRKEKHIIDKQRSANISISVLTKLKHVPMEDVKKSIINVNTKIFDEVLLENLLNNLPTQQEIDQLKTFMGEKSDIMLSKPDSFCFELICISKYKERLQSMLLLLNFQDRITHMSDNMTAIMIASTTLRNSIAVKEFLNLVLLIGNFLNGSNYQGGAYGIRISSINKLIDTKSSQNDTTLLHFMIETLELQFPETFNTLLTDLKCCVDACKVTLLDLINDYSELKSDIDQLSKILLSCEADQDSEVFCEKLNRFHEEAINQVDQLEVRYTSMDVAYKDVLLYFGEDPSDTKLDDFFGIFVKFMSDWETTYRDLVAGKEKVDRMNKVHQLERERKILKKVHVNPI